MARESRAQKMFPLIKRYRSGSRTRKQLCDQYKIPISTFDYWHRRYRQQHPTKSQQDRSTQPSASFLPITLANDASSPSTIHCQCCDGFQLTVPMDIPQATLLALVSELRKAV